MRFLRQAIYEKENKFHHIINVSQSMKKETKLRKNSHISRVDNERKELRQYAYVTRENSIVNSINLISVQKPCSRNSFFLTLVCQCLISLTPTDLEGRMQLVRHGVLILMNIDYDYCHYCNSLIV
jgi:hypothetical protein